MRHLLPISTPSRILLLIHMLCLVPDETDGLLNIGRIELLCRGMFVSLLSVNFKQGEFSLLNLKSIHELTTH